MIEAFDLGLGLSSVALSEEDLLAGVASRLSAFDSSLLQLESSLSGLGGEVARLNFADIDRKVNVLIGEAVGSEGSRHPEAIALGGDAAVQADNETVAAPKILTGEADIIEGQVQPGGYRASTVSAGPAVAPGADGGGGMRHLHSSSGYATDSFAFAGEKVADFFADASGALSAIAAGVRLPGGEAGPPFGLSGREFQAHASTEDGDVRSGWAQADNPLRNAGTGFAEVGSQLRAAVAAGFPAVEQTFERPAGVGFLSPQGDGLRSGSEGAVFDQAHLIAPINDFVASHAMPPALPVATDERNGQTAPGRFESRTSFNDDMVGGSDPDRATTTRFGGQQESRQGEAVPLVVHTSVELDGDVIARAVGERVVAWMNGPIGGSGAFDPRRSYTPIES